MCIRAAFRIVASGGHRPEPLTWSAAMRQSNGINSWSVFNLRMSENLSDFQEVWQFSSKNMTLWLFMLRPGYTFQIPQLPVTVYSPLFSFNLSAAISYFAEILINAQEAHFSWWQWRQFRDCFLFFGFFCKDHKDPGARVFPACFISEDTLAQTLCNTLLKTNCIVGWSRTTMKGKAWAAWNGA